MAKVKKKKVMDATQCRPKLNKCENNDSETLHWDREKPRQRNLKIRPTVPPTIDYEGRSKIHLFQTLRGHNLSMVPVQKLPSGIQNLLAETFRKMYGSTIFATMEYAPFSFSIHASQKI